MYAPIHPFFLFFTTDIGVDSRWHLDGKYRLSHPQKECDERDGQLGLNGPGKTTLLYKWKLGEIVKTIPTIGEISLPSSPTIPLGIVQKRI